jgi:hypothetical protein
MKRFGVIGVVCALLPTAVEAGGFQPKISEVCVKSRSGLLEVDRRRLVAQLVEKKVGLSGIDIDTTGADVTYDRKAQAITDIDFCKKNSCAKGADDKLGLAWSLLNSFLAESSRPGHENGFLVVGASSPGPDQFLIGTEGTVRIECFLKPGEQLATPSAPATSPTSAKLTPSKPRQYFAVRKNIDDFRYSQSDEEFKKVERANLAIKDDFLADSRAFSVDGAVGYTVGPRLVGPAEILVTPFVSYKQDYVNAPGTDKDKGVYNLGTGVMADLYYFDGRMGHDLQVFPKFVHSLRDDADTLVSTLVYSPQPAWPYVGAATVVIPKFLSAQFTPQLKAAEGAVFDAGSDPGMLEKGNYFRWGPKIALAMFGEARLKGFVFNLSYETYDVYNAKIDSLERFEASIDYTIGEKELWALQLKYVNGQDLDTWEDENQVTLGAGLKY